MIAFVIRDTRLMICRSGRLLGIGTDFLFPSPDVSAIGNEFASGEESAFCESINGAALGVTHGKKGRVFFGAESNRNCCLSGFFFTLALCGFIASILLFTTNWLVLFVIKC